MSDRKFIQKNYCQNLKANKFFVKLKKHKNEYANSHNERNMQKISGKSMIMKSLEVR